MRLGLWRKMDTLGDRLKIALERADVTVVELERRLKELGLSGKGAARTMIHRYLKRDALPQLEFVEAVAPILGVRRAWLAFGDGKATAAEQLQATLPKHLLSESTEAEPDERQTAHLHEALDMLR
ncbi:MAG TPA: hypothetical protein VMM79_09335, partial [Longimicrobiales bacterium]|nr:hypothetical protein [Longimicrobiales bacterium]